MSKPFIVACIPAYNEALTIGHVVLKVKEYVDEVVVCDDGSADFTGVIAKGLGATLLEHEKNRGKGATLRTLFEYAVSLNPDVIVTIDADYQHNPEEIPKVVEPIIDGRADVVIGSRYIDGSKSDLPSYRRFGLKLINTFVNTRMKNNVSDSQCGFRAFSLKAAQIMSSITTDGFGVESEQLHLAEKMDLKIAEVPVEIRYMGIANKHTQHPLSHGVDIIGSILTYIVEKRPLSLLSFPGFLISIGGLAMGLYFLMWFNKTRYFSVPMALLSLGGLIIGSLLIVAGLILWAITRTRTIENENS